MKPRPHPLGRVARDAPGVERFRCRTLPPIHAAKTGFARALVWRCCCVAASPTWPHRRATPARRHVHHRTAALPSSSSNCSAPRRTLPRRRRRQCRRGRRRPDRGHRRIELFHRIGRNVGQFAAKIRQTIHRQHADAAAIGQYRQPLAGQRRQMTEGLRGGEQLVEIKNP